MRQEKITEALDITASIFEDLRDERDSPTVTVGMSLNAAIDNAQILLDTLVEIKKELNDGNA